MKNAVWVIAVCLMLIFHLAVSAQLTPDPALLAEIMRIRAIDNHAHPLPFLEDPGKHPEYAVADSIPNEVLPARLRSDNPEYIAAWRSLFGYRYNDLNDAHLRELLSTKQSVKSQKRSAYPVWVLDKLGVETMFTDRPRMESGLVSPRFRWVWRPDAFLFPFNNQDARKNNPQRQSSVNQHELQLKELISEAGLAKIPQRLDDYLNKLVIPILQKRKNGGAMAIKFTTAYDRSLDFADVPEAEARRLYAKYIEGDLPSPAEYKAVQDYLFRRMSLEAGRLGLVVHIHVGAGEGGWFHNSTASPFLLDPVLNDSRLRGTKFVLIHGGLPFANATRFLLDKENVWADFSSQAFLTSDRELAGVIRSWLEFVPEKVLFGTDAYPVTKSIGWEEIAWVTNRAGRRALAMALTEMMNDGVITRTRASTLARMVMRDNAAKLYNLP